MTKPKFALKRRLFPSVILVMLQHNLKYYSHWKQRRKVPHDDNETPTRSCFPAKTCTIPLLSANAVSLLHTSMHLHHNKTTTHQVPRNIQIYQHGIIKIHALKTFDVTTCVQVLSDWNVKDKAPKKIWSSASVVLPALPEDCHRPQGTLTRLTLQRGNNPSGTVHPCHTHWHVSTDHDQDHTLDLKGEGVAISGAAAKLWHKCKCTQLYCTNKGAVLCVVFPH